MRFISSSPKQKTAKAEKQTRPQKGDICMKCRELRLFTKIEFFLALVAAGTTGCASRVESPFNYEKEVAMELKKLSRKGLLLVFLSVLLFSVTQQSNAQTICSNQTGTQGGFFYSFWKDSGSACMTLGSGGSYGVSWNLGSGNLVFGKGWNTGS